MTSNIVLYERGAEVLGYVGFIAAWQRSSEQCPLKHSRQPTLVIYSCADTDERVHIPAQSITINSRDGLLALQKAIEEALKEYPPKE